MSDHDALIDRLRDAARVADPEPPELLASASAAFGLYRFDEELAELLHDSARDDAQAAGVRATGTAAARLVSFAAGDVAVDLEISVHDGLVTVTGVVTGPVTSAAVRSPSGVTPVDLDELGRFHLERVAGPAVRVEVERTDGRSVVTDWVHAA